MSRAATWTATCDVDRTTTAAIADANTLPAEWVRLAGPIGAADVCPACVASMPQAFLTVLVQGS